MIERRLVDARLLARTERLHEIDLDARRPLASGEDLFVDVLGFALVRADRFEAEQLDPERAQALPIRAAEGYLLHPEHTERTLAAHG
jgi:hypothetical protein